jgi:hypothetical protein
MGAPSGARGLAERSALSAQNTGTDSSAQLMRIPRTLNALELKLRLSSPFPSPASTLVFNPFSFALPCLTTGPPQLPLACIPGVF